VIGAGFAGGEAELVELLIEQNQRVSREQARLLSLIHRVALAAPAREFGADEISCALTWTVPAATSQAELAFQLHERLPAVLASLAAGQIDLPKARVFVDVLSALDVSTAQAVAAAVLPIAPGKTTGQLRDMLRRRAIAADPAFTTARRQRSESLRQVQLHADDEGTATFVATGLPADRAAAAFERVNAIARSRKLAGDPLNLDQLRADTLLDLLDGAYGGYRAGTTHLTVSIETLARLTDDPASLGGYGPVAADIARQWAKANAESGGQWQFSVHDPAGALLLQGTTKAGPTQARPAPASPASGGPASARKTLASLTATHPAPARKASHTALSAPPAPETLPIARPASGGSASTALARGHAGPSHSAHPPAGSGNNRASAGTPSGPADQRSAPRDLKPAGEPRASEPGAGEPGASEPGAGEPGASEPAAGEPRACEPGAGEPGGQSGSVTLGASRARAAESHAANSSGSGPRSGPRDAETYSANDEPEVHGGASAKDHGGWVPRPPGQDPDDRLPNKPMTRWIRMRDKTCRAPGCRVPAHRCDLDHTVSYASGGRTTHDRLGALCRHHHRMKHLGGWRLIQLKPGHFRWISPTGRIYDVGPEPP
jgi:hypothetical protein